MRNNTYFSYVSPPLFAKDNILVANLTKDGGDRDTSARRASCPGTWQREGGRALPIPERRLQGDRGPQGGSGGQGAHRRYDFIVRYFRKAPPAAARGIMSGASPAKHARPGLGDAHDQTRPHRPGRHPRAIR